MKKVNYLLSALMLAGCVSMTSCMETEEPDSVKELRAAQLEYTKALAQEQLEKANAQAETAKQAAIQTQTDQVELDKTKATYDNDIELAKVTAEKNLLAQKVALAQSTIGIAKTYDDYVESANELETAIKNLGGYYDDSKKWVPTNAENTKDAKDALAEAEASRDKAKKAWEEDKTNTTLEAAYKTAEENVEKAQDTLADKERAEKYYQGKYDEAKAKYDAEVAALKALLGE